MIALALGIFLAPIRVACVGDSITWGVGTADARTQGYPAQLQRALGDSYIVGNFGHSGATLTRGTDLPYWSVPEYKASLEFKPDIVVIMLGTNDATPARWPKVKDTFVPQYKELVEAYRGLSTHPKVYVCVPVPSYEERQENIEAAVVPLCRQVAREENAGLIDLHEALDGNPGLFPDKLHPNVEGAGMMAEAVAETVEDVADRKKNWHVVRVDSQESDEGPARFAIDGDPDTYWHTAYSPRDVPLPHEIVVDMGSPLSISAFRHLPRQDGGINGRVRRFEVYFSADGKSWGAPILAGEMPNVPGWTSLPLPHPIVARYFRFRAISEWHGGPWTSVGELDVRVSRLP